MKVLHVINGEYYAGAEKVQDLLAMELTALGHEVSFVCFKPDKFPALRTSRHICLHSMPMRHRFDLGCARQVAALVRQGGFRLLHTHSPRGAMVGRMVSTLTGVPMVHHVHSPAARDTETPLMNRINCVVERLSASSIEALIPVSRSLERYLVDQGFARQRIFTVPNGVPTPGPLPSRDKPTAPWRIGAVALFRPRKGIEILLRAAAQLLQQGRPLRVVAVGGFETPAYEQEIRALCRSLGISDHVDWLGFTRDVNGALSRLDVMVLPSLYGEGMPMAVLEAMAVGVPVVASDVEGIPEVLEHGRTGLVVPSGNATALAMELAALMDGRHDWARIRQDAYRVQCERYSSASMARAVSDIYAHVLS
ncbi:glycosyltransferase [Azohydromonas caseinilytica]|uniref:Glycosyltransferase family 4 protein n=1 Tax=Azohydromonas caseinilytica TaxID=2728836 RepID=A0A848FI61_9BURK|nr:glycosyltransferase [Azohydromonas caseinilytica]NML17531.1 glycosyltransferase family 4 protein [Azohydromonas caseinilytica]